MQRIDLQAQVASGIEQVPAILGHRSLIISFGRCHSKSWNLALQGDA